MIAQIARQKPDIVCISRFTSFRDTRGPRAVRQNASAESKSESNLLVYGIFPETRRNSAGGSR